MPGLPWLLLKAGAKMTAKGAAVTFTSTVASCTLACYIEIGAHRAVYHYFPHKYAHVEWANGLTQEQLDAVRVHEVENNMLSTRTTTDTTMPSETQETHQTIPQHTSEDYAGNFKLSRDTSDSFWKEEKRETRAQPMPLVALGQSVFSSNDILACSMTC